MSAAKEGNTRRNVASHTAIELGTADGVFVRQPVSHPCIQNVWKKRGLIRDLLITKRYFKTPNTEQQLKG